MKNESVNEEIFSRYDLKPKMSFVHVRTTCDVYVRMACIRCSYYTLKRVLRKFVFVANIKKDKENDKLYEAKGKKNDTEKNG